MIPTQATHRLAKLVPLLGSNIDAEALAAARAIGRALSAACADWHDLAEMIKPPEWCAPVERRGNRTKSPPTSDPTPPPEQFSEPPKDRRPSFRDLTARQARETIAEILRRLDLARAEIEFLRAMADRLYASPHEGLTSSEVRGLNRIWRRGMADAGGLRQ